MRDKNHGASIAQYAIILTLIGMVVFAGFATIGQNIVSNFSNYNDLMKKNNEQINNNIVNSKVNPSSGGVGPLGGTASNPVNQCSAGVCKIDYGEFLLEGIPEDFDDFVASSGTSSGTNTLASAFAGLAAELRADGKSDVADELDDMGNIVAFMSQIQSKYEDVARGCAGYDRSGEPPGGSTVGHCIYYSRYNNPLGVSVPSNLSSILTNYDTNETVYGGAGLNDVGKAKYFQVQNPGTFSTLATQSPAAALVAKFDAFYKSTDPNISSALKNVVKEMYVNVNKVAIPQEGQLRSVMNDGTPVSFYKYDPITGEAPTTVGRYRTDTMTGMASDYPDLNAALKCATGGPGC